jgi:hypothetical protein
MNTPSITKQSKDTDRSDLEVFASAPTPRPEFDDLMANLAEGRRAKLEAILAGETDAMSVDEFEFAVELDGPTRFEDHQRLIFAASLAIQYWRERPRGTQKQFIRKVADTCGVNPSSLDAYITVLQGENRHRRKTGQAPLAHLPKLTTSAGEQGESKPVLLDQGEERPALPAARRTKHDPLVYVQLANEGLNNCAIAGVLDVSEATVRRGLKAVGYIRQL